MHFQKAKRRGPKFAVSGLNCHTSKQVRVRVLASRNAVEGLLQRTCCHTENLTVSLICVSAGEIGSHRLTVPESSKPELSREQASVLETLVQGQVVP